MRAMLLAASVVLAAAVPSAPAFAGDHSSGTPRFGVTVHRGDGGGHHRRGRDNAIVDSGGYYYGGEWALYNNRTWESDSYNDWWHDKPERSFPRWVTSGQCARQWYAADTLRC